MMRADTISRTEALTAYSQAREESVAQMIGQTGSRATGWCGSGTRLTIARVREWHASMDGQRREPDEPFTDGLGNLPPLSGRPAGTRRDSDQLQVHAWASRSCRAA
jgi:hypothetical protein